MSNDYVTGAMVLSVMGWSNVAPYPDYAEEYAKRFNAAIRQALSSSVESCPS